MVVATGIDIVEIPRIRELIRTRGRTFVERWFSEAEIAYCERTADPAQHYAARMAAKEATVKVLGIQWDGPIRWREITVCRAGVAGPAIRVAGASFQAMRRRGIVTVHLSLSRSRDYAVASVIAEGPSAAG